MTLTILILFAPVILFILYARIRMLLKRRKKSQQATPCVEKPYEPGTPRPANIFLRHFSLTTQLYLRQQWNFARFGFLTTLWILTVLLCSCLFPPFEYKFLTSTNQRIWFDFVTGISILSTGLPVFIAIFAGIIATVVIVSVPSAPFTRTRPIPLRVIFWGRILTAMAAFLLAAVLSIGIAFSALRIAYGPVWHSVPTFTTGTSAFQGVLNLGNDGTASLSEVRHLLWLTQNPAPRIFASILTTMTLLFSAFVLAFCQPFTSNQKFSPARAKWVMPMTVFGVIVTFDALKAFWPRNISLQHAMRVLFFSLPYQAPPPWRFLPVPIVLSALLLLLSERLYLRRDI